MSTTKPRVTLREAQLHAKVKRLERDLRDCYGAAQTAFYRCACGRVAERGIRCPTNREGGHCEAGK